jgi:pyrimidine-specific ribonucleoside hydrolase
LNRFDAEEQFMFRKLLWVLILVISLGLLALASPAAAQEPRHVIIDTDMGADDWMAILYLLKSPNVSVEAITVTGTGLAECTAGTQIALGLLAMLDFVNVPVSCWTETPLRGENAFPPEWRVDTDTASNLGLPDGDEPADADAVTLFTSIIESANENIDVLALGPLTNVGAALQASPDLVDKIDMIYIMGGALDVPGSGISRENSSAEWNFYVDPYAARLVFESGAPITLVPLDATNEVPVTQDFLETFDLARQTQEADFVYNVLAANGESIEQGWYYFWDPLAAAILTDENLVSLQSEYVTVIDDVGRHSGRTVVDSEGSQIFVATQPDGAAFEDRFIETLNN